MITSLSNPKIQRVRALQRNPRNRRDAQAFVVEGVRLAEEALAASWPVEQAFFTEELGERGRAIVEVLQGQMREVESVTPQVMSSIGDTETPQGILLVLHRQAINPPAKIDFVFVSDGVRDPGNLGSILRTAAAAGVQAVALSPGTVDAYSPKVLRAAMGAHFRLPIIESNWLEINTWLVEGGLRVFLAATKGDIRYDLVDLRQPLALIISGEASGASSDAEKLADERLQIPMPGGIESLNTAAAAAIILFEVVRQRGSQA
jgi:TrmH family RNA methyltransferase